MFNGLLFISLEYLFENIYNGLIRLFILEGLTVFLTCVSKLEVVTR